MKKTTKALLRTQRGQTFPLVLIILAIGSILVTGFLRSANSSLLNAKVYSDPISDTYAADAGIEDAIWGLQFGTLSETLDSSGGYMEYILHEPVNNLTVIFLAFSSFPSMIEFFNSFNISEPPNNYLFIIVT